MKFQVYFFFMLGHIYMHMCVYVCVCMYTEPILSFLKKNMLSIKK